jgi:DNA-binding response OmpR family regulator
MKSAVKEKTAKVLVVDDERAVCNMLKKFLTKKGYSVNTALSGKEAIKAIRKEKPHVVLLDIRMPGIDGVETLKRIRKLNKNIGIVMITAVKEDETGRRCLKLGAYDYITKPLSLDYLENVLIVKLFDIDGRA